MNSHVQFFDLFRRVGAAVALLAGLSGCIGDDGMPLFTQNAASQPYAHMGEFMADDYRLVDMAKACAVDSLRPDHPGNAETILAWSKATPPNQLNVAQAALLTAEAEAEHLRHDVPPDLAGAHGRLVDALNACRSDPKDRLLSLPASNRTWWTISSPDDPISPGPDPGYEPPPAT